MMAKLLRKVGAFIHAWIIPSILSLTAFISGLVAFISFLVVVFSPFRLLGLLIFVFAAVICYFSAKIVKGIYNGLYSQAQLLVDNINVKESLKLNEGGINADNMLGYPNPEFMVFDKGNQKIAICNRVTGDYKINDFDYVLKWYYDWDTGTRTDMHIAMSGGTYIPGTLMREPTITQSKHQYQKNFTLVLEVADVNKPFIKIPMISESAAKLWCAKLNAYFSA